MLEKIGKIANGKLLSSNDQKLVVGGRVIVKDCRVEDNCGPGFCCSRGVCVSMTPKPGGYYPACE
jgi:hypothetical protein